MFRRYRTVLKFLKTVYGLPVVNHLEKIVDTPLGGPPAARLCLHLSKCKRIYSPHWPIYRRTWSEFDSALSPPLSSYVLRGFWVFIYVYNVFFFLINLFNIKPKKSFPFSLVKHVFTPTIFQRFETIFTTVYATGYTVCDGIKCVYRIKWKTQK